MEKNNAIGQRLGEWIKGSGKKEYEIAELLGILPQQLSHVLNGRDGLGKTMQERLEKCACRLICAIF